MRIDDGRQVRAARAILGMTVMELAEAAGLHKNSVLRVEAMQRIRQGWDEGGHAVQCLSKAIEARGVQCRMLDEFPIVAFATAKPPPRYRRRQPDNTGREQGGLSPADASSEQQRNSASDGPAAQ